MYQNKKNSFLVGCIFALIPPVVSAQNWTIELKSAVPYNLPTSLSISQRFEPNINLTARYESRPFTNPLYYDFRIAKWDGNLGWEFEDIHHKIYLKNTSPDVKSFSISHGYNLFYLNRVWKHKGFIWRVGTGLVIGHAESVIRNQKLNEHQSFNDWGYYLAGASIQGGIEKRFYLTRHWFGGVEAKVTTSYACVPIVDGHAVAPNVAIHGSFGLGYDFG